MVLVSVQNPVLRDFSVGNASLVTTTRLSL